MNLVLIIERILTSYSFNHNCHVHTFINLTLNHYFNIIFIHLFNFRFIHSLLNVNLIMNLMMNLKSNKWMNEYDNLWCFLCKSYECFYLIITTFILCWWKWHVKKYTVPCVDIWWLKMGSIPIIDNLNIQQIDKNYDGLWWSLCGVCSNRSRS